MFTYIEYTLCGHQMCVFGAAPPNGLHDLFQSEWYITQLQKMVLVFGALKHGVPCILV